MKIKFEGNTHSIDANTLVCILVHYQTIANEVNRVYGGGERDIRINVNAVEKGSFVIDLSVAQGLMKQIFSKDTVEYVAALTGIIFEVYSIYKIFKGRPVNTEKDINEAKNQIKVNVDITLKVYNQPFVREAISKSVEKADEDPSIESFAIIDKDEQTLFPREEFKDYIYDDFENELEIPNERTIDEDTTLTIVGLKFEKGSRWQFLYNGFKINITVKDDALMKKIDEGERFGKGDAIRVKLRTVQTYNPEYKAYENKSYKIIEFKEHIFPISH